MYEDYNTINPYNTAMIERVPSIEATERRCPRLQASFATDTGKDTHE